MEYKVSVIVPIFKVENFIYRCAQNLLEQSLDEVEYIFVDDCSPDKSIIILEDLLSQYPNKEKSIKLIRHNENKGLPTARNTGLLHATGEFVFHCDSDDWLERNALEELYHKAIQVDAEIVWCDWYLSFEKNERYMSQSYGQLGHSMSGLEVVKLMLGGRLKYNVWNKMVKRNLYSENDIWFPDGYGMGEDMTMIKLFAVASRVSYLNLALYHYVQLNNEAFTKKTTKAHLEQIKYNVDHVVDFLQQRIGHSINESIQFFKLNVKLPFLITSEVESYDRWNNWYPESNPYIDLNPLFNFRTKLIQKAAIYRQYWFLRLYYRVVVRLIYGVLYR